MRYRYLPESGTGMRLEARTRTAGRNFDFRLTVDFVIAGNSRSADERGGNGDSTDPERYTAPRVARHK